MKPLPVILLAESILVASATVRAVREVVARGAVTEKLTLHTLTAIGADATLAGITSALLLHLYPPRLGGLLWVVLAGAVAVLAARHLAGEAVQLLYDPLAVARGVLRWGELSALSLVLAVAELLLVATVSLMYAYTLATYS